MTFLVGLKLPEEIERGAVGGPQFNTTVLALESGVEKRNKNWSQTVAEYDIGYGLMLKFQEDPTSLELDLDELLNFFYVVGGKFNSFRFKDWSDYEIGFENGATIDPQFLALGDDTTTQFQVFKRYAFASAPTHDRTITKLVGSTVQIFKDTVLQTLTTDYSVDEDRGLITFVTAPASTGGTGPGGEELVEIRTEFDVHVRFDTDASQISMAVFNAGNWASIPLMELRGTGL
jgi:uncharacterized protein (TIGR02217 family)